MSYNNETCEGCVHLADDVCDNTDNWISAPNAGREPLRPTVWADSEICDLFKPSLECRKVRALEELTQALVSCVEEGYLDIRTLG